MKLGVVIKITIVALFLSGFSLHGNRQAWDPEFVSKVIGNFANAEVVIKDESGGIQAGYIFDYDNNYDEDDDVYRGQREEACLFSGESIYSIHDAVFDPKTWNIQGYDRFAKSSQCHSIVIGSDGHIYVSGWVEIQYTTGLITSVKQGFIARFSELNHPLGNYLEWLYVFNFSGDSHLQDSELYCIALDDSPYTDVPDVYVGGKINANIYGGSSNHDAVIRKYTQDKINDIYFISEEPAWEYKTQDDDQMTGPQAEFLDLETVTEEDETYVLACGRVQADTAFSEEHTVGGTLGGVGFLVKLKSGGTFENALQYEPLIFTTSGSPSSVLKIFKTNHQGILYVCGYQRSPQSTSASYQQASLSKVIDSGSELSEVWNWTAQGDTSSANKSVVNDVTGLGNGFIVITGEFNGTVHFDPNDLNGENTLQSLDDSQDIFVALFCPGTGEIIWAKGLGAPYDDENETDGADVGVNVRGGGNQFGVSGNFTGLVDFDPSQNEEIGESAKFQDQYYTKDKYRFTWKLPGFIFDYYLLSGSHTSGEITDVDESDDEYLRFNFPSSALSPPTVQAKFYGRFRCLGTVNPIIFSMESSVSHSNIVYTIKLYNFDTEEYDVFVSSEPAYTTDATVQFDIEDATPYIDPETDELTAEVTWTWTGSGVRPVMQVKVDFMIAKLL